MSQGPSAATVTTNQEFGPLHAAIVLRRALKEGPLIEPPSEVLPDFLWIGNGTHAASMWIMNQYQFTHIVNASGSMNIYEESWNALDNILAELRRQGSDIQSMLPPETRGPPPRPGAPLPKYLRVKIQDVTEAPIAQHFEAVGAFIDGALQEYEERTDLEARKPRVLVHCFAGVSRSSTLVIAYLMMAKRMSLNEAFQYVLSKRPVIHPNSGFCQQLVRLHQQLYPHNVDYDIVEQLDHGNQVPAASAKPDPNAAFM